MTIAEASIFLRVRDTGIVDVLQAVIVAPHLIAEVWRVADTDTWRDAVTDHLHLIAEDLPRLEEAVERGIQARRRGEVVHAVEAIDTAELRAVGRRIVLLDRLVGVPALVVVRTQREVDIAEELIRSRDGYVVREAIVPVLDEVGLEEAVLLRGDAIAELSRVADADLLVPALCPDTLLALEGVDTVHTDSDIRQAHRDHRVGRGLRRFDRGGDAEGRTREVAAIVDRGVLRILRRDAGVVERGERVVVEGARRVVHARREGLVGVGLRVLRMRPVDAEVTALGEVPDDVTLPRLGREVAEVDAPPEAVALAVVRAGIDAP